MKAGAKMVVQGTVQGIFFRQFVKGHAEDLKLRGHGDILGFQQSGIKNFKFADPIHHKDLFLLAEENIKNIDVDNIKKFETLLRLYDRAEIINEIAN